MTSAKTYTLFHFQPMLNKSIITDYVIFISLFIAECSEMVSSRGGHVIKNSSF